MRIIFYIFHGKMYFLIGLIGNAGMRFAFYKESISIVNPGKMHSGHSDIA